MCRLAQAYIDNLKATGQCEDGVICGLDGTAWTGGLALTAEEGAALGALLPPRRLCGLLDWAPPARGGRRGAARGAGARVGGGRRLPGCRQRALAGSRSRAQHL